MFCCPHCSRLARFILETDDPSGRTWARKNSLSDNSTVYKRGQADGSFVKTSYLRSSSVQTNLLAQFALTDDPSACPRLYTDELLDELSFYVVRLDGSSCVYT